VVVVTLVPVTTSTPTLLRSRGRCSSPPGPPARASASGAPLGPAKRTAGLREASSKVVDVAHLTLFSAHAGFSTPSNYPDLADWFDRSSRRANLNRDGAEHDTGSRRQNWREHPQLHPRYEPRIDTRTICVTSDHWTSRARRHTHQKGTRRRRWDSNPRSLAGHTISSRADSAALALLLGAMRRYSLSRTRRRAQWPGSAQQNPVNRVRVGRQQLSADSSGCRRGPGCCARRRVISSHRTASENAIGTATGRDSLAVGSLRGR
jgi:hypothetical protein